jgi:hypothetical protein
MIPVSSTQCCSRNKQKLRGALAAQLGLAVHYIFVHYQGAILCTTVRNDHEIALKTIIYQRHHGEFRWACEHTPIIPTFVLHRNEPVESVVESLVDRAV